MVSVETSSCREHYVAAIIDVSEGGVRLLLPVPLAPGSWIELQLDDGVRLDGVVRHCRETLNEDYSIGVETSGARRVVERRKEPRFSATAPACLSVVGPEDRNPEHSATICDVSRSGLGLKTKEAVLPGRAVEVRFGMTTVHGIVRNCHPLLDGGFRVGITIHQISTSNEHGAAPAEGASWPSTIRRWVMPALQRSSYWVRSHLNIKR